MHRLSYKIMMLITIIATLGGILSLLPAAGASYPNIIGYSSLCTFAPAASFYCFLIAGTSCLIRSSFIKDQSGNIKTRMKKHIKSLIPLLLVAVLAIASTISFVNVKSDYTDAQSAATLEEN